MSVQLRRRRFTVDEYYAMADAGILTEDDRVELIEGEVIQMAAIGSQHAACVKRLNRLLIQQLGDTAVVQVQDPVRLSDITETQPDLAVLRARDDFYAARHPTPPDTMLVIEVAHSSLGYDREVKVPLYARSGTPEVWIVDVEGEIVEVYREPAGGLYSVKQKGERGTTLRPQLLPGLEVGLDAILG